MSNILKHANPIRVGVLSSDPSGAENGTIYYNSSTNKFRKYENGSFGDIAASEVLDSLFRIQNSSDPTKEIAFDASGIATGTTRTVTMPDSNVDLGLVATAIQSTEKGAANGVATLDAGGLLPTAQLPPLAITSVFVVADQAARLALTAEEGDVAIQTDNSLTYILSTNSPSTNADWKVITAAGAVTTVNGQTGTVSLDTDDISEGSTNLYYTAARFNTAFAGKSTTDLAEGTNLYYTTSRFNTAFAGKSTTDLAEGTNLYYTSARFNTAFGTKSTTDLAEGTNLYYTATRFNTAFSGKSTTDLSEGTNQYFTTARAKAAAVADAIADGVTDVAPSQNAVFDALALKLSSVSQDTAPQLGGALDLNGKNVEGLLHRAAVGGTTSFVEEQYIHSVSLLASQTDTVLASLGFAHATFEGIEVTYKMKEATSNKVRIGKLRIATNGTDLTVVDDFAETADVGVSWSAVVNGANIDVRYTSTANAKTMRADIKRFKA